jgi:hypothetical protein
MIAVSNNFKPVYINPSPLRGEGRERGETLRHGMLFTLSPTLSLKGEGVVF